MLCGNDPHCTLIGLLCFVPGLVLALIACIHAHSATADSVGVCMQIEISLCPPRRLLTMAL